MKPPRELQVGVKILLENSEGKFLLIRRSPEKYPEVKEAWDIIGGRIDVGTPLLENLQREVNEETGLEIIGIPRLIAAQDILRIPERHVVRLTYIGKTNGEPHLDADHLEARWFTLDEIRALTASELDRYFREIVQTAAAVRQALQRIKNPAKAKILKRFFKTGKGEYGEGDQFLGIVVPEQRKIAKQFRDLPLAEVLKLLQSSLHEERFVALIILINQFAREDDRTQQKIYTLYLANTRFINNWDLVDCSAEYIVGAYLAERSTAPLTRLAHSRNLWERRIAMLSTFHFIKKGDAHEALRIAHILVSDHHDLIHKAVGWMLREIGEKCSREEEEAFLTKHAAAMPRTMLRYAIEKFPPSARMIYLKKNPNVHSHDRSRNPRTPF